MRILNNTENILLSSFFFFYFLLLGFNYLKRNLIRMLQIFGWNPRSDTTTILIYKTKEILIDSFRKKVLKKKIYIVVNTQVLTVN